jgi:hypothetical protein
MPYKFISLTYCLHFDLHLNTTGQLQFHKCINGFGGGTVNIEEPFVGTQLKLLPGFFIDERRPVHRKNPFVGG